MRPRAAAVTAALMGVWLAIVVVTTFHHEYWRDEVRPWSLAGAAHSPIDLFHRIRYEGHPILWYLLLFGGRSIVDIRLILPVLSLAIAAGAMTVLMLRSPFPLWLKAIFLFSALPLYEYSVMARNYGLSMLLLFLFAALYPGRQRYWLPLAVLLALLANTNVHSIVLASLLLLVWIAEELWPLGPAPGRARRILVASAIAVLGIALGIAAASPPPDTVLTSVHAATPADFAAAFRAAVLEPAATFTTLFLPFIPWALGHVVLYVAVLGLVARPALALAAFAALVSLGVVFRVAYVGSYRHAGLLLCFLIGLYWMALDSLERSPPGPARRRALAVGCYGALAGLVLIGLVKASVVSVDLSGAMSSGQALGAYLTASARFRNAIVVPEPDYYIESLPYYASNAIYFPREHRFGNTVTWSSASEAELSLRALVAAARELKARHGRPVLIAIGHPAFASSPSGDIVYPYRKRFTWSTAEREEAERYLEPVRAFVSEHGDENYWVYSVR